MSNAITLARAIVLVAGFCCNCSQLTWAQEDAKNKIQAQNLMRYGMVLPRPVDAELRERRGYPEPRPSNLILEEIDEVQQQMKEIRRTDDIWKQRFREHYQLQRKRISLISELEESGYQGSRLPDLLTTKVTDISKVWNRSQGPVAAYSALNQAIVARYRGTDAGNSAQWHLMLERIHFIIHSGMHVAEQDYPRIAQIDLQMPDPDMAGMLLLESLRHEEDNDLKTQWYEWMVDQLSPKTAGYRIVMRKRMFGSPIRLQGDALRGGNIDTEKWKGDVVLVDFWGMWCAPCKAAMPHLKELGEKYGDRGLRIVGVFVDHEFNKAREYLKSKEFDWPQIIWPKSNADNYQDHPIVRKYAIGGYPTLWLIDRSGIVHLVDRDELETTILGFLDKTESASSQRRDQ